MNPRTVLPAYSLSRGAPSATWVLPRVENIKNDEVVSWRREWDSNPRPLRVTGFQDRLLKPLGHLSIFGNRPNASIILAYSGTFVNGKFTACPAHSHPFKIMSNKSALSHGKEIRLRLSHKKVILANPLSRQAAGLLKTLWKLWITFRIRIYIQNYGNQFSQPSPCRRPRNSAVFSQREQILLPGVYRAYSP